jgi:hypothetical protein
MIPSGKLGAEPTIMMVFGLLRWLGARRGSHSHRSLHRRDIGPSGLWVDGDDVHLDVKVPGRLPERSVGGRCDDPRGQGGLEGGLTSLAF